MENGAEISKRGMGGEEEKGDVASKMTRPLAEQYWRRTTMRRSTDEKERKKAVVRVGRVNQKSGRGKKDV